MSYEGYTEYLCTRGHYMTRDCRDDRPLQCDVCNLAIEYQNSVDQTNGETEHACTRPEVRRSNSGSKTTGMWTIRKSLCNQDPALYASIDAMEGRSTVVCQYNPHTHKESHMRFAITNATGQCVVVETEQSIHEEPHVDTVMHDFFDRPRADIVQFERPGELIVYTDTPYSRTYYNEMHRDIVLPQDEIPIITWYEQCNTGMLLVRNGHLDREQFLEALCTNNAVVIGDARKMVRIDVVW